MLNLHMAALSFADTDKEINYFAVESYPWYQLLFLIKTKGILPRKQHGEKTGDRNGKRIENSERWRFSDVCDKHAWLGVI